MSERNDPGAETGKPAADRDEPARDRRPDPQATTAPAAGQADPGGATGPAVPDEPPGAERAASATAPPHGDPLGDKVAPEGTPPGGADAATVLPPAAPSAEVGAAAAKESAAEDTTAKDTAAKETGAGDSSATGDAGSSDASAPDAGGAAAAGTAARVSASDRPESAEPGEGEPSAKADEEPGERSRRYDCAIPEQRAAGLEDAATAIRQGKLVVIPTDTVYGIGADAFTPSAVNALLAAKGRGRDMPVPVLVGTVRAANALVEDLGPYGQDLIDEFWPGPLTIIGHAGRSLRWDLGETKGTVALRMPLHAVALDLLKETGPMAVSSANRSGAPPATTVAEAEEQLGDAVAVYLDGGRCTQPIPSTIVDLTTPVPRVLRKGAIPVEKLKNIVGYVATDD